MKNKNLVQSFNNAINGIIYTIKSERNMKIHVSAAVVILLLSMFYNLTKNEFVIVCMTVAFVLVCELFNTAIEVLVDTIIGTYHEGAKIVKDVMAGAVLISALLSLIVAYIIFYNRFSVSLQIAIERLKHTPMSITIIALISTILIVIIIKSILNRGTPFSGGMPSGHSAVAFSASTAIALWTDNISITILALVVSLLVIQSRLEGKIHNIIELLAGAVLGVIVTLLIFQVIG